MHQHIVAPERWIESWETYECLEGGADRQRGKRSVAGEEEEEEQDEEEEKEEGESRGIIR